MLPYLECLQLQIFCAVNLAILLCTLLCATVRVRSPECKDDMFVPVCSQWGTLGKHSFAF
jgi:hypothetical protein